MQSSTPDKLSSGSALVPNLTKCPLDLQASLRRDKALDHFYAADRTALIPTMLREMQIDEILWSLTSVILIGLWGARLQSLTVCKAFWTTTLPVWSFYQQKWSDLWTSHRWTTCTFFFIHHWIKLKSCMRFGFQVIICQMSHGDRNTTHIHGQPFSYFWKQSLSSGLFHWGQ